jgi:serine/threonine protein kinase/tetratricopeptide (TPR) repeat protein
MRGQGEATKERRDSTGFGSGESRSPEDLVAELAEAFLERHRRGERPSVEEYAAAHPELAGEIRRCFRALLLVEDLKPAASDLSGSVAPARGTAPERLGDYRILREVGRGGMGVVYEAEQESLGRRVALKVLAPQGLRHPRQLLRFHREAKATARLHHTNIVPVFGVGESEGLHYYVMQFIPGLGLDAVLEEIKRLRGLGPEGGPAPSAGSGVPSAADMARSLMTGQFAAAPTQETAQERPAPAPATAAAAPAPPPSVVLPGQAVRSSATDSAGRYARSVALIGEQVAEALEYAHRQGILHRDIKPSNLLLDGQGTVWVADFGLAKAADSDDLTHTGDIVGTVRYLAPERFEGRCDARSDVYALGLTLYELLALRPAFDKVDRAELIRQVTHEEPPRLRALDPTIPRDLETVVHKAIEREPGRRYGDAAALAADLRRFVEGRPSRARRVSAPEHAWRWCRRNPAVAVLAAAVFLTMAVGTVVSTGQAIRARRAVAAERAAHAAERAAHAAARAAHAAARARADEMRAVLEFVEQRVLAAARPEGQEGGLGRAATLRQAIDAALPFVVEGFAAQPLVEARLRRTLGTSYLYLGDPPMAAEQLEASRALSARHRGPDDPETLVSMNNLAVSYAALGRRAEALKLLEQTLALMKAKLGPDHRETLMSMNNLADSYEALGRRAEALQLREETLRLRQARLGPEHPDTLMSMNNLANSYDDLGRRAEALKLREQTLRLRRTKLGPDHPDTRMTINDLAGSYQALGRWEEALAAYRRAIALDPGFHDAWNHAATLWARTGDRAGYRGHCRQMLDRFGRTTDPAIAERTAKACLLVPLGGPEQEAACDLADRAVAMAQGHRVRPWAEATRGLAAYRREQFADAVAWADRGLSRGPRGWNLELPAHLVRAMALSRLGRRGEARAALARASDLYRTKVANPGGRAAGGGWHDQVICEVLRREAEAVFLDRDFPADPFARREMQSGLDSGQRISCFARAVQPGFLTTEAQRSQIRVEIKYVNKLM